MPITVSEAVKLDTLKDSRLIAGKYGLYNAIEKVGILEYEIIDKIEGQFGRGDFVISSLFFARDDAELLFEAVKSLVKDGVSALGIKNIYYDELPDEIIGYANEKSFPIFIFDNNIFFEDIITDITDAIRDKDNYELLETKVDSIINNKISRMMVRELALEINSSFKENFTAAYCKEKKYKNDGNIIRLLERVKRNKAKNIYSSIFKYRDGILIIYTYENLEESSAVQNLQKLIEDIGIDKDRYFIGISSSYLNLNELDKGLNESFYAAKTCEIFENSTTFFKDIGIFKILLPFIDEVWINDFYKEIINPLKSYDEKYNTQIFNTAVKYIENEGNVKKTSQALFQHDNTIRYRINKMKEILGMENLDGSFYEQLSIAVKIYKINLRR